MIDDRKVGSNLNIEIPSKRRDNDIGPKIFKKDLNIFSFHVKMMELMVAFKESIGGVIGAMSIKIGA